MSRGVLSLCRYYFEMSHLIPNALKRPPDTTKGGGHRFRLEILGEIRDKRLLFFIAGKKFALKSKKKAPLQPSLTVEELVSTLSYLFENALYINVAICALVTGFCGQYLSFCGGLQPCVIPSSLSFFINLQLQPLGSTSVNGLPVAQ